jgi:hypothetical protein
MTKTKYEVCVNKKVQYSCVTTNRDIESVIDILKDKFKINKIRVVTIYRIVEGVRHLVYVSHATKIKKK